MVQQSHDQCQGPASPENTHGHRFVSRCPCLCDFQPRCSTTWQGLSDMLRHSSAGNDVRFTNVPAIGEPAIDADVTGDGRPAQNNPSCSAKGPSTSEENISDPVSVTCPNPEPRPKLIGSMVSTWPTTGQSKFPGELLT